VVSPLHDVLTEHERRAVLAENPDSYLHVTSDPLAGPEEPRGTPAQAVQVQALRRLLDVGAYRLLPEPSVFVYRMREVDGEHTGVVAGVDMAGFMDGRVLGHERVQPARVDGLVRHYDVVPTRSELVVLFHRRQAAVDELIAEVAEAPAMLEFTDAGGVEQSVWRAGPQEADALSQRLGSIRHYIADGHHRVAAALQCWARDGRPRDASILCALYPHDQVTLHAFHRRLAGPVSIHALLEASARQFDLRGVDAAVVRPGAIGLYAARRWHVLTPRRSPGATGVEGLDVSVLHDRVLRPLLDVEDGDPRLDLVPDLHGLSPMMAACDDDGGVLFTLHAPRLDDVIAVAERGEAMRAKTTYVKPKPRTGIFLCQG
jgi:uncharacterized protein (DUF1015 family)